MSFKIFNEETNKWEIHASTLASSMKVMDLEGKFKCTTKNVETCLSEIKDDMTEVNKAIKYVYDHGGNGDGSGGGGFLPTLDVIGPREYIVTTDQQLTIEYSFTSNNRGNGFIQLTGAGKTEEKEISQGRVYQWKVGPFSKGRHNLSLNVRDSQGFWSGIIGISVNSGALELVDHYNHDISYLPGETVEIPYEIVTAAPMAVNVLKTFNGNQELVVESQGEKVWNVKLPNVKGIYKASIKASSGDLESNTINYTLIAADSKELIMTSSYPTSPEVIQVKLNQNLSIDYTNSMLGQTFYDTYFYIDDFTEENYVDKVRSKNGRNYWIVGDRLEIGPHKLKIKTVTSDGQTSQTLDFLINVSSTNFIPHPDTKNGLIAHFESAGNMNNSDTRNMWRNRVTGSDITCELHNFNYNSNGWAVVDKVSDLPITGSLHDLVTDDTRQETVLRCSGKSYAVIDYEPFLNGVPKGRGFTFEVVYRVENTGDPRAKVVSCKNEPEASRGFDIDTEVANIRTVNGEQASIGFNENEWTRMSFVVNRAKSQMYIYCNGVLSGFSNIAAEYDERDGFRHDGKIILGAAMNKVVIPGENGQPSQVTEILKDFANCDIRTVRIYNRALSANELVDNFIADIKDEEEQMILREVNGLEEGFEATIPSINVLNAGDINGSPIDMPCVIDYVDPKDQSKSQLFQTCTIKWQGTSSLEYPIKNYTVNIKEEGRDYYGWAPKDEWKPEARWTLKANYMDSSQSNNVGASKYIHDFFLQNMYPIQREVEGSRTNVDGFPIKLYVEGVFKGIYTFNIDRYSYNNYGFCKYNPNGSVTKNTDIVSYEFNVNNSRVFELDYSTPEKELKAWNETVRYDLKHRYNGKTDQPTELISSGESNVEVLFNKDSHRDLMELCKWMAAFKDTTEDRHRFIDELDEHFSIPHLTDYFLIAYLFGMIDNLGKNMVLTSYGKTSDSEGNQLTLWYPTFYDCDSILGLNNVGANVVTPGAEMNTEYVTQELRLWKWIVEDVNMWDKIKRRYIELRSNVVNSKQEPLFSLNNAMSYFGGRVSDTVGQLFYNEDYEFKYLNAVTEEHRYMCQGSRRSFIERWLRERLIFLDSLFGFGDFEQQLLTMRSNTAKQVVLEVKTYSPQKTSILFQAGSEPVVLTTNKNTPTRFTFNLTNNKDNEIKIKGAANIMEINGLDKLNLSILKVGGAKKLTNIELPDNEELHELVVSDNRYLRILDVSNCSKLGANYSSGVINQNKSLNLSECENLRTLRCNNTAIEGVTFPVRGGVLDELDCSNTGIVMFNMTGQEYLDRINLASCNNLSEVLVARCDGLVDLDIPKSALRNFSVTECKKLENIDISFTNQLQEMQIDECLNVKKLNMSGVSNKNITELNLTSLLKLEDLNVSSSSSIKHIVFGKNNDGTNFNKLKKFNCKNSSIMTIRYALYDDVPTALDLAGLPLTEVSFDSCKNVQQILNIKLVTSNGSYAFNECTNLTRITGELTFSGSMTRAFNNCINLTSIPLGGSTGNKLDLTNVTSMSETFWKCKKFNMNTARDIMTKVSSKLVDSYRVFCSCDGITGQIPATLFNKCTGLKSISEFFYGCSGINGGLDVNIFAQMTALENCYYSLASTSITGGLNNSNLPETLFVNNRNLKTLERMFYNTKLLFVPPENLLATNTNLTNVYGMFSNCANMVGSVPERIFRNNSKLTSVGNFFGSCPKVDGEIPRKIFDTNNGNNNSLNVVEHFFNGTKVTGEIPQYVSESDKGIFDYSPNLSNARYCFSNCSGITGVIPPDLFKYNTGIQRVDGLFNGCIGLGSTPEARTEIPEGLLRGKRSITNTSYMFSNCQNVRGSIPAELLLDCPNITDISGMFMNCKAIVGQIPARESTWVEVPLDPERPDLGNTSVEVVTKYGLFDKCTVLSTAREVFSGCTGLNSFIPPTLLVSGTQLTDITNLFANCHYVKGGVPSDLFAKCGNLQTTEGAFLNCVSLREAIVDPDDEDYKYIIPKDLFAKNPNLNNVKNMFRMDGGGNPHAPKLEGALHKDMFKSNSKLRDIYGLFHACINLNGTLHNDTFANCPELKVCYESFGETKLTGVGTKLFSTCKKVDDMRLTFDNCRELTGEVFDYSNMTSVTQKARCFGYCSNLNKYAAIKADGWAD